MATEKVLKLLKRDIHNSVINLLMDEDFIQAYEHEILVECSDGVLRLIFPHIFVYSADYPERSVLFFISNVCFTDLFL